MMDLNRIIFCVNHFYLPLLNVVKTYLQYESMDLEWAADKVSSVCNCETSEAYVIVHYFISIINNPKDIGLPYYKAIREHS